ncbi:choice-of-anchor A domain-containing protein, partial [Cellulosimicrobium cellulans J1]
MTRSSSPFTSARPRGPRRLLAAATAAALALSGALVVVAGPSAAPASAVPGQCPAPGEMPGIGNLPPKFTDNNVAVYAGGNYLATGSAAESEGVLLVRGDATFDKDPDGLFNVGTVGVGSQITPDPGALMLAVGGDLTIVGTNTVQVGAGLTPGGAVQVGGALTAPAGQPETEGAPVTTGMGQAAAMSPFADFQDVITETSASLGTATATGTATRDGGRVTFTSTDPSNVTLQAFTIDAADLDGASEFFFAGIPADAPVVINVVGGPVAVSANYVDYNGVRADDLSSAALGEAASRILWNFVDAEQVDITGSGQFIGSILAPAASSTITSSTNGRVYVGNDLTTAGSGNEQHNYPWIGPGPFDCIAGSEGGFSVAKLVDGTGAASVPAGTEFTVTWSAQVPDGVVYEGETSGTLTLLADGTVVDGPSDLPEGTVVTLAEPTLPELPGIAWGTPAFDPSAEITIGAGSTTAVTLTNTATLAVGGFSLSKAVQGSGAGAVPGDASFTVAWTAQVPDGVVYDGATTGTVTVLADGTVADGPQDLPVGTVVTFEETVFPEVPGISWGTPVLDPSSVTVGDGTNTLVTVTNAAVQQVGGFSVAKSVEGEASGLVPDDAQFTVEYSYELDGTTVTGSLTVLADGTPVDGPQNLPVGTVVTFTEVQLPEVEGVVWGAPSFSPSSVTVGDGENALVTLTNTATDAPAGGFSVAKSV